MPTGGVLEAAEARVVQLIVTAGEPPEGWFAAPLGVEAIAIVVHPSNRVRNFTIQDLAGVFSGRLLFWNSLGGPEVKVLPVVPLPGDEVRLGLEASVLAGSELTPRALLAPCPAAMVSLVSQEPGAIGAIPLAETSGAVRIVRVEGVLPDRVTAADGSYPLTLGIVAVAPEEPSGSLRDWLVWVQASFTAKPADSLSAQPSTTPTPSGGDTGRLSRQAEANPQPAPSGDEAHRHASAPEA
jgi:ABC-type phosphate transport system substrate-binding protein